MGSIHITARMWPDTWDMGISVGDHDHCRCRCGGRYGGLKNPRKGTILWL